MKKLPPIYEVLPVGTKILASYAGRVDTEYDSYVYNIDGAGIYIAIPSKKGEPMKVSKALSILVYAYLPIGKLSFQTTVEAITGKEGYTLSLAVPERYEITQSRQYFRVPTFFDILLYQGSLTSYNNLPPDNTEPVFEKAVVDNISGGGCRIGTDTLIHQRELVVLDFTGSVVENVSLVEAVAIKVTIPDKQRRFINLRFEDIDESTRTHIIRYVFRRELELRQLR
jgi:c-di-GMP-binding flagellar brake protein YcgR